MLISRWATVAGYLVAVPQVTMPAPEPFPSKAAAPLPGADTIACPVCHAVRRAGRWQWQPGPAAEGDTLCPACQRIRDGVPAGELILQGEYLRGHRRELMEMVQSIAARNEAEHALERLMAIDEGPLAIRLTATDARLVRSIANALQRTFQGRIQARPEPGLLRVSWRR
jgi:hypothetical protein